MESWTCVCAFTVICDHVQLLVGFPDDIFLLFERQRGISKEHSEGKEELEKLAFNTSHIGPSYVMAVNYHTFFQNLGVPLASGGHTEWEESKGTANCRPKRFSTMT